MKSLIVGVLLLLGGSCAIASTPPALREPANLDLLKGEVREYVRSGGYERAIAGVAAEAEAWLKERSKRGGSRLTVVMDLDETLLSNTPLLKQQDFGYVPAAWDRWVAEARAPAIKPMVALCRTARTLGMEVVFLSGRRASSRAATERNLHAIGCGDDAALILMPEEWDGTTGAFKVGARMRLEAEGRTIVANIGDQVSDLEGGAAEKTFKLPNPFYITQ